MGLIKTAFLLGAGYAAYKGYGYYQKLDEIDLSYLGLKQVAIGQDIAITPAIQFYNPLPFTVVAELKAINILSNGATISRAVPPQKTVYKLAPGNTVVDNLTFRTSYGQLQNFKNARLTIVSNTLLFGHIPYNPSVEVDSAQMIGDALQQRLIN